MDWWRAAAVQVIDDGCHRAARLVILTYDYRTANAYPLYKDLYRRRHVLKMRGLPMTLTRPTPLESSYAPSGTE
ncbi:hypothetical protein F1880_003151 [Penicillium rolfsii]|nr:hypothetical protein F1880_003151 [Penicillium rolfsii]